ncbi:MAG: DUF2085 domain-containing protein [Promethearchaeota archaeon]
MTEPSSPSRRKRILQTLHLLISHHEPPYMNRTWSISFRGRTLHICTRCSALLLGILAGLFIHLYLFLIPMNPITFFGAFLLSVPAVIDWSTQTLEMRESRTFIRAITGFLLGYAVGLVLASNDVIYWILVAVLYSGYTIVFGSLAPRLIERREKRKSPQQDIPPLLPLASSPQRATHDRRDEE